MKRSYSYVHLSLGALSIALVSAVAVASPPAQLPASDDPQPAPITILTSKPGLAPGLIFVTPAGGAAPPLTTPGDAGAAAPPPPGGGAGATTSLQGPEIVDNQGRPVWFKPLPAGIGATDFRVQQYRGEPVLTWIQSAGGFSTGPTTDYIADRHYDVIASVQAGSGYIADTHEFRLTAEGTALISVYHTVPYDLSSVGGPTDGKVTEGIVQEIDVASGRLLFEWHSLDHVALDESHEPLPASAATAWDYFHLNSVNPDVDGNLLISSRHTWTVYKLDRHTGAVIWRLGGKKSDFDLGPGVAFAWQHNPLVADGPDTIRIFDNESAGTPVLPYSRVIWVKHDDFRKTATLERWFKHPDNLSAASQGNSQALVNGDTFVGWGQVGRYSEFDHDGNLLLDAAFPSGYDTYRAYRDAWIGEPETVPAVTAATADGGGTTVHAIWNGATQVARWTVLGGSSPAALTRIDTVGWNGLDTSIALAGTPAYVQVVAEDAYGLELGRSAVATR
jgi:hypothetical protein